MDITAQRYFTDTSVGIKSRLGSRKWKVSFSILLISDICQHDVDPASSSIEGARL